VTGNIRAGKGITKCAPAGTRNATDHSSINLPDLPDPIFKKGSGRSGRFIDGDGGEDGVYLDKGVESIKDFRA
jgi:hypothetical protein